MCIKSRDHDKGRQAGNVRCVSRVGIMIKENKQELLDVYQRERS
jgi:hypothetical protein